MELSGQGVAVCLICAGTYVATSLLLTLKKIKTVEVERTDMSHTLMQAVLVCRVFLVLMGGVLIGTLSTITMHAEPNQMHEQVAVHEQRIGRVDTDIKEMKDQLRDLGQQLATIRGMGLGFGGLIAMVQLAILLMDKRAPTKP